jgi:hypothetical protein
MPKLMRLAVTIVIAAAVLRGLVWWLEPRMAFFPYRGVQETPAAARLPFDDLEIPTRDGETLHAWWLAHPTPRAQVIFWHGNGGNLSLWLDVIVELRRRGFSVLAVDYRGYGASTGRPSEKGVYKDADAALDVFNQKLRHKDVPVIFWGRSLGSAVASYSATKTAPDALVLESPFPDVRYLFRTNPVMWVLSLFSTYRFPTSKFVASYSGPLLVVHGEADTIVPYGAGRRVFERAPTTRKTFAAIPGADHNDLHVAAPGEYWKAIDAFVDAVRLTPSGGAPPPR